MVNRLLHWYAHGMNEWLLQRLTAVFMALYALALAVVLLVLRPAGYIDWRHLFDVPAVRICTFAFILSLLLHAWLGIQGVLADYVKPQVPRRALKCLTAAVLVGLACWSVRILWGNAA